MHLNGFFTFSEKTLEISCVLILEKLKISLSLLYVYDWQQNFVSSNTVCNIIIVIKQIGLSLSGRPILLITCMITDRIGLHSVLHVLQCTIIKRRLSQ